VGHRLGRSSYGNEEIWFARIAANGAKLGSDVLVSNAPGNSRTPSIVWAGGKYGIAWSDDRNSVNDEIYFTPLGCDCVDGDGDGSSSCVDCADGNPSVYPGAAQVTCNGVPNDCNNPVWPTPLGVIDEDSDGFAPCEGDCNDANASVWATPGEAGPLTLTHDPSTGITTLFWLSPASPGTTAPVLRHDSIVESRRFLDRGRVRRAERRRQHGVERRRGAGIRCCLLLPDPRRELVSRRGTGSDRSARQRGACRGRRGQCP
jgi:hypothetical protein